MHGPRNKIGKISVDTLFGENPAEIMKVYVV
jgi:hypothetical protein